MKYAYNKLERDKIYLIDVEQDYEDENEEKELNKKWRKNSQN